MKYCQFFFLLIFFFPNLQAQERDLLDFIARHPEKFAFILKEDDSVLVSVNATERIPQAGLFNMLIAIEYAKQVASGRCNPEEKISLKKLDSCNYSSGNYEVWRKYLQFKGKDKGGYVTLSEVVKGMISFSSDANATFLMNKLDLEAVNRNIYFLGIPSLKTHEPLYQYQAASVYTRMKETGVTDEERIAQLRRMPLEEYVRHANITDEMIQTNHGNLYEYAKLLRFDRDFAEVWYEKLPKSTPQAYFDLIDKIHSQQLLPPKAQAVIEDVLESLVMDDFESKNLFKRCGFKSGTTPFSLSIALYATMPNGKRYTLVSYLHHLDQNEYQEVAKNFHSFNLILSIDEKFRQEVIQSLRGLQNK